MKSSMDQPNELELSVGAYIYFHLCKAELGGTFCFNVENTALEMRRYIYALVIIHDAMTMVDMKTKL